MEVQNVEMRRGTSNADGVVLRRVLTVGLAAVALAVIVNVVLLLLVSAVYPQDPPFLPLTLPPIIVFTAVGALMAVIVFAILTRFTRRPIRLFQIIAIIAFVVTLVPNVLLAANPGASGFPGASATNFLLLLLFHIPPALIPVWLLSTRTRAT